LQGRKSLPSNLQLPITIFHFLIHHLLKANMFGDLGGTALFEITPELQWYSYENWWNHRSIVALWLLFHNKKWQ